MCGVYPQNGHTRRESCRWALLAEVVCLMQLLAYPTPTLSFSPTDGILILFRQYLC